MAQLAELPLAEALLLVWLGGAAVFLWRRLKTQRQKLTAEMAGMVLAHAGIGVFVIGVLVLESTMIERDVAAKPGMSFEVREYTFAFDGVAPHQGPNYDAIEGLVILSKNGRELAQLRPQKRMYRVHSNPMTEADIRSRITGDIYVSLGQASQGDAWVVRLYYKPFVTWIWGGCVLMALGGGLAAADRRYRVARREQPVPAAGAAGATA